jgi:amino acid transporter
MALIINKMVGTGIFSTPSLILSLSGSIGLSLVLWLVGALVTFCGLSVYLEFGLAMPVNGGEKNYLQRVYRSPAGLVESVYAFQIVLLGFSSANSYAFGKYILFALGSQDVSDWASRLVGCLVISTVIWIHICHPYHGTRVFTVLGVIKILVLLLIVMLGLFVYMDLIELDDELNDNFKDIWAGADGNTGYSISVALLQVIYSFKGWENANYVLSEIKDPHRTLKVAAPLSVALTAIFYFFVIVSYYLVIPSQEIKESGVLIAGIFFQKIFGDTFSSRMLPFLISISNFGNVLAVAFSHARINQELARERLIPFPTVFSMLNNSLLLHWLVTILVLIVPPSGDIYQLVVNLYSYPGTWINALVAGGLIYLHFNREKEQWGKTDWRSHWTACAVFLVSNLFLAVFPFLQPPPGYDDGNSYPYYVFPATGCGVLIMGVLYWLVVRYKRSWANL